MKFYALFYLADKFEQKKTYTEPEVNALLNRWHTFEDPATLRRELYNCRFLDRDTACTHYVLEKSPPTMEELLDRIGRGE